jgi:hypothetical protein
MEYALIDFSMEDLRPFMVLSAEEPLTHSKLIELARSGIESFCGERVDKTILASVTHPNLVDITIGPKMDIIRLLMCIGRKFIEDYNYALRQALQDKVA